MINITNYLEPSRVKVYGSIKPQLTEHANCYYVIWPILFVNKNF